jgi:ketosteroid isomerase-like protein
MRKFDQQSAIIAIELQNLIAEFGHDLDTNNGLNATDFYTEDGVFAVGDFSHRGHAAIRKFYSDRAERIRTVAKDGIRVSSHTFNNARVTVTDQNNATIEFINVNYGGEGKPPVLGPIAPAMVTNCRMVCRREADGIWRITSFSGTPAFVGVDPFINKMLLKS